MQSLGRLGSVITRNIQAPLRNVRTFQNSVSQFSGIADENSSNENFISRERTVNQVTLLGRVGRDPVKKGSQEHPVSTFSLATHSTYGYSTGELMQKTEWHRIVVFKPSLIETVMRYVGKGNRILVQGRLIYGEMKDSEGQTRTTSSIVADDVIFLGQKEA